MLRIAQCNETSVPIVDGVGRVVFEYAKALGLRGHESYMIAPSGNTGYRGKYPFEIVDFAAVKMPKSPQYSAGIARLDAHYSNRIDQIKLDIVHAHSPGPSGLEGARLAAKQGIPLIGTFHSKYHEDILRVTKSEGLAQIGVRYVVDFFDRCDEVWTVSNLAADTLRGYGYRGRIEVVPHGTAIPTISRQDVEAAKKAFTLSNEPVLLYTGQMDWKKNLRLTLNAAASLYRQGMRFQLVLAGQGHDEGAIRALVQELELGPVVTFTGHITEQKLLNGLYAVASLFVFPSNYDTAGLVVREAAAAGTPSVVLAGSAPAEVVDDNINGFLCEDDTNSLAGVIARALADPAKLDEIGAKAKRTIPQPWETVVDGVVERYEALVDREKFRLKRKRGILRKELTVVDRSIEKRAVTMMRRFLRRDLQHVYAYGYTPVKRIEAAAQPIHLPRSSPEEQGVSSRELLSLYHTFDADIAANLHALMVVKNGYVIAEGYWAPYEKGIPHQLYSFSKSVTGTAIGMLIDEGRLSLDERVVDIFAEKVAEPANHPFKDVTVWHLLTMSSGARFNELGTALGGDWIQEFLDSGVRFAPGTQFSYNSLNTYVLAAIIYRKTGQGLLEFLKPRLFEPLGIQTVSWEICPQGIEKGGWGLSLTVEEMAKLGLLYLQKGRWNVNGEERQLLSSRWVEEATRVQIDTPHGECKDGYGYQVWMAPTEGGFLFNGAFGQYMVALPRQKAVVAIQSGSGLLFAQSNTMAYVRRCLMIASGGPIPHRPALENALLATTRTLSCRNKEDATPLGILPMPFSWVVEQLGGRAYAFTPNTMGLFPVALQSVHNVFSEGITHVCFTADGDGLLARFTEGDREYGLRVIADGFARTSMQIRDECCEVAVSARFGMQPTGAPLLRLHLYFLETPFTRVLTLACRDDSATLTADELPTLQSAAGMLMAIANLNYSDITGMMPILRNERLQDHLLSFAASSITGKHALEGRADAEGEQVPAQD